MVTQEAHPWIKRGICPIAFNMHQGLNGWLSLVSLESGPRESGQGRAQQTKAPARPVVCEESAIATAVISIDANRQNTDSRSVS